jgi:hypothetical protein
MADPTPKQGAPLPPPPLSMEDHQALLQETLDQDPSLQQDYAQYQADQQPAGGEPPSPQSNDYVDLWTRIKNAYAHPTENLDKTPQAAVARGALKAVNEGVKTAVNVGATVEQKTGLYKLLRNDEEQRAFMDWYNQPSNLRAPPALQVGDTQVPLTFSDDQVQRWLGPAQGGTLGFIEGAAQFSLGMLMSKSILKGVPALKGASSTFQNYAAGGVTDALFFDPYQKRLSNLIQDDGPSWLKNPLTDFLKSDPGDSQAKARFKNVLEGMMTAVGADVFMAGLKFSYAKTIGKGTKEAATELEKAVEEAHSRDNSQDEVTVTETDDGRYAVKVKSDPAQRGVIFSSAGEAQQSAAVLNYSLQNGLRPKGIVTPEMATKWKEAVAEYQANGSDPRTAKDLLVKYGFNINYTQRGEESINQIKALVDVMPGPVNEARNRPRTWDEAAKDAEGIFKDMTGPEVLQRAATIFKSTDKLDSYVFALKQFVQLQGDNVKNLSRMVDANPNNAVAMDQLASALDSMLELHSYVTGTNSNVARALNINKMPVGEGMEKLTGGKALALNETPSQVADTAVKGDANPALANNLNRGEATVNGKAPTPQAAPAAPEHRAPDTHSITEGLSRDEVRALARAVSVADDPAEMVAILAGPKVTKNVPGLTTEVQKKNWFDYANAVRMEAMLSGPKTQVTNALNNAMVMMQQPAEYWWAGHLSNDPALKQMGADMFGGLLDSYRESWSAAKKAFATGDNVLDQGTGHGTQEAKGSMLPWGEANWLQRVAKAPSRLLMSSDEFFKQMNYRANLRAQILKTAREQGITDPGELAKRLTEDFQFGFTPDGGAVNVKGTPGAQALEYARIGTFTNDLNYGIGQWLQEGANKHPMVRVVLPFIRTPTNIIRYAWQRTPVLGRFQKEMAEDLAAGGERGARAQAKIEMGYAAWTTAATLAASGVITGGGPADADLRRQWKEAGYQPYSVKVGNRWVSYRRGDPSLAPMGLVADLVSMSGELNQQDFEQHSAAVIASIASNLSSKTFLQGITETMDALSSGREDKVQALLEGTAGSFIPNALRQANPDDTIRETQGMVDELKARLPGFSTTLEPRRNMFGEKVMRPPGILNNTLNPFTVSAKVEDGNVADELLKLGKAFSMPPEKKMNGLIDLKDRDSFNDGPNKGQSPYDRLLDVMANPPPPRKSLRAALEDLVQSDGYQRASDYEPKTGGTGGIKYQLASRIVTAYQEAAWGQVLGEYPSLKTAVRQAAELQGAGLKAGRQGVDDVMGKYNQMFAKPRAK